MGGWLGYFDGWKGGIGVDFLRIVRRREAGIGESKLWVAVVGLDDLVDGMSEMAAIIREWRNPFSIRSQKRIW